MNEPSNIFEIACSQPRDALPIRKDDEGGWGVPARVLERLATIAASSGDAKLVWINAGLRGILPGPAIVNAWRGYADSLKREGAGLSWPAPSRQVGWRSFGVEQPA
jgi:hypothetical protein